MIKIDIKQDFIRKQLADNKIALLTSFLVLSLLTVILFMSEGYTGGTDTLLHYKISKYAFSNPEFFLDQWAKPVFTILSAPFALFGLKGIQFFNILLGVIAGYFAFLVSKELNYKNPVLTIIFCCFTPVFMLNLYSGLTEILFAAISIISVYFLLKKRYLLAALFISLLPLIISEGFYLIVMFGAYYILVKKYKYIPWLLFGFIIYSIIGLVYFKNLSWLFTDTTLVGLTDIKESGSFFQFVVRSPGYFGIPNEIMMGTGLVASITVAFRGLKENRNEFLLIVIPFLVYFVIHSLEWYTGTGNSQGLNRYMAAVVPFVAVMALRGMNLIALVFVIISKKIWFLTLCGAVGVFFVIYVPFVVNNYPVGYDKYGSVMIQAAKQIKEEGLQHKKIISYDPFFFFSLDINPLDPTKFESKLNDPSKPELTTLDGDIFIHEGRFSNIAGVSLDTLMINPSFKHIGTFKPEQPFMVMDKWSYQVNTFQRIDPKK